MCQLLGMNANVPTDICFSFSGFQKRGGITDEHKDGWGIAFFEGKGVRQFLDSGASAHSPIAEFVREYPIQSTHVISHIRKATQGDVRLDNTHPFMREAWGKYWIFAHNGNLFNYEPKFTDSFRPVGTTDSERAFCFLLQELKHRFKDQYPGDREVFHFLAELIPQMVTARDEFNFLLSNGESLFAHASTNLTYIVRKAPFTTASLKDQEMEVDFSQMTTPNDRVALIATAALTQNETWLPMPPGTFWMFQEGDVALQAKTIEGREPEHHELCSK